MYMLAEHPMIGRNRFLIYSNEPQNYLFHNFQDTLFWLFCQSFPKKTDSSGNGSPDESFTAGLAFGASLELPEAPAFETGTIGT